MAKKIVTTSLNLSKTSYNYNGGSIPGSKKALSNNIPDLINELRYTNGQMGSVQITTAYTLNDETIEAGWYNYIYIPHRVGGKDGAASGDNVNFGNLLLTGMTLATRIYKIRLHNGSIGEMQVFARMSEIPTTLSQLSTDSTHRVVTDTEKTSWNNKFNGQIYVSTTGTDLNDYTTSGIYVFNAAVTPTNIPEGVNGTLIVYKAEETTHIIQLWYRWGSAGNYYRCFIRSYVSGAWQPWKRFFTEGENISLLTNNANYITDSQVITDLETYCTPLWKRNEGYKKIYPDGTAGQDTMANVCDWIKRGDRDIRIHLMSNGNYTFKCTNGDVPESFTGVSFHIETEGNNKSPILLFSDNNEGKQQQLSLYNCHFNFKNATKYTIGFTDIKDNIYPKMINFEGGQFGNSAPVEFNNTVPYVQFEGGVYFKVEASLSAKRFQFYGVNGLISGNLLVTGAATSIPIQIQRSSIHFKCNVTVTGQTSIYTTTGINASMIKITNNSMITLEESGKTLSANISFPHCFGIERSTCYLASVAGTKNNVTNTYQICSAGLGIISNTSKYNGTTG